MNLSDILKRWVDKHGGILYIQDPQIHVILPERRGERVLIFTKDGKQIKVKGSMCGNIISETFTSVHLNKHGIVLTNPVSRVVVTPNAIDFHDREVSEAS